MSRPAENTAYAAHLQAFGPVPDVVFDAGVEQETQQFFPALPATRLELVDPCPESRGALDGPAASADASFHEVAQGSRPGRMELAIPLTRAGVHDRRASLPPPVDPMACAINGFQRRMVEVSTLDAVAASCPGPAGLKIDTVGHETDVLSGGRETLRRCIFGIPELSMAQPLDPTPRPGSVLALLVEVGLESRDVLRSTGDGAGGPAPRLIDALFTRWPAPILHAEGA